MELVDAEVLAALSEPGAGSDTLLHSLFGRAEITCAEPVMIGVDNELERTAEYRLPGLRHRDLDTAFAAVFDDIVIEPEESVEGPDELLEGESASIKREPDELESPEKLAEAEAEPCRCRGVRHRVERREGRVREVDIVGEQGVGAR